MEHNKTTLLTSLIGLAAGLTIIVGIHLTGCGFKTHQITAARSISTNPADTSLARLYKMKIYPLGKEPKQPYSIRGKVKTSFHGGPMNIGTEIKIQWELRRMALRFGADAIVGYYTSKQSKYEKIESGLWGSGLAVKWLDSSGLKETPGTQDRRGYFITAIKPWNEGERGLQYLGILTDAAQYYLERQGYYAPIKELPLEAKDASYYTAADFDMDTLSDLSKYFLFGKETELVLTFQEIPTAECLLLNTRTPIIGNTAIKATLFSKTERRIIWENCRSIDSSFRSHLFGGGRSRGDYDMGLIDNYRIIKRLFETLPRPRYAKSPMKTLSIPVFLEGIPPFRIDSNQVVGNPGPSATPDPHLAAYADSFSVEFNKELSAVARLAPNMLLYDAVARDDTLDAKKALELGADINFSGYNENTPLHTAAIKVGPATVNFLLRNGAKQDLRNESGLTPLDIAEGKGNFVPHPEIASILKEFKKR